MPLIDDLLLQAQRDLSTREVRIVAQLLESYGVALGRIERELRTIDAQIAELIASGGDITEQYIRRQRWWREVEASIQREMARWSDQATQGLTALQSGGVKIAVDMTSAIATAAGSPFQGRVYAEAFERWVSATQPGSPLRIVIDGYESKVRGSILQRMTEGIGGGKAPRSIVREIMADVGGIADEARIMTLARTETMRAFRGASADTYTKMPDGVITGYRWKAAKSARTCIACLAMDGTVTRHYPMKQHPACRCVGIPVISEDILPGASRGGESGAEWFAKQDETTQRRILISDDRYAAYASGVPISDMVTTRQNPIWGESIGVRPMRDIPKGARANRPTPTRPSPSRLVRVQPGAPVPGFAIPRAGD